MKRSLTIPQLVPSPMYPAIDDGAVARGKSLLEASGWYTVARYALWAVIATASIKPAEIFGVGEQVVVARIENGAADLLFRIVVLLACMAATFLALVAGRVRRVTLIFIPFLIWTGLVSLVEQADSLSVRQLASYATWIFFLIGATSLLDRPGDVKMLRNVMAISVLVSAMGGIMQFALGHAPMIGLIWDNVGFPRIHTGGGGILLDAFTPYCAAILFLVASINRPRLQIAGVLFALWASGNILRGGLVAFTIAMLWLLAIVPKKFRVSLLKGVGVAFLLVVICFGGKVMQKSTSAGDVASSNDQTFNTSGRLKNWPLLLGWISESPIWGHGPNADMALLENSDAHDLRAPHNELLSTAINFGIVGTALLWLPLLALLVITLRLAYKHRHSQPEPMWAASTVLLMVAVLSLTDNTLRLPGFMILGLAPACIALNRQDVLRESW